MTKKERKAIADAKWLSKPENKRRKADYMAGYSADYYSKPENRARRRNYLRERNTGVTPTEFNFTLAGQNFCCANCGADEPGGRNGWHADHCHATGRFRGVLCMRCNTGIGKLGDNVEGLLKAVEYLLGEALPTSLTKQILQMDGRLNPSQHIEQNESKHTNWSAGLL